MYQIKATNIKTLEILLFPNLYDTTEDARLAIDHDIEWDEDDIQEDWKFDIVEADDKYEEPADIDDDCGFDPYCGCYTYDCQGVATMRDLIKVVVWFFGGPRTFGVGRNFIIPHHLAFCQVKSCTNFHYSASRNFVHFYYLIF